MSDTPARIGSYAIEARLGAGGMAETFVARRNMQGVEQRVCLKRILPAYAKDVTARRLFEREASVAARLRHANLVTIFDVGEDAGAPYLVMELVEGSDLGAILDRAPDRRLPADLVAFVLAEIAHGLHEAHGGGGAHAGVVHRDLSPGNVLVSTMGEVKVADFGIAKALSGEKVTATVSRGKFAYMAPEQFENGTLDPRADFFALGVMGYEMIAGVRPFDSEHDGRLLMLIMKNERRPVAELAPHAPRDLLDTIEALLSPSAHDRPADGHAIVERLASVVPSSMVARRKMGALARTALEGRLSESKDPTSPDAQSGLEPTISAPEPSPRPEMRDIGQPVGAPRPPVVVGPIGTNPSLDSLPTMPSPASRRSSMALLALGVAVVLAVLGGGGYALTSSGSATPATLPLAPPVVAPPTIATAPSTPVAPVAPTTPIADAPPVVTGPVASATPTLPPETPTVTPSTTRGVRRPTTPTTTPTATTTPAATPSTATADVEPDGDAAGRGTLHVIAMPWGNIWVDHRLAGRAPISIPVSAGRHTVQAGFDNGPQVRRTVRVRAGQTAEVDFDLTALEAP